MAERGGLQYNIEVTDGFSRALKNFIRLIRDADAGMIHLAVKAKETFKAAKTAEKVVKAAAVASNKMSTSQAKHYNTLRARYRSMLASAKHLDQVDKNVHNSMMRREARRKATWDASHRDALFDMKERALAQKDEANRINELRIREMERSRQQRAAEAALRRARLDRRRRERAVEKEKAAAARGEKQRIQAIARAERNADRARKASMSRTMRQLSNIIKLYAALRISIAAVTSLYGTFRKILDVNVALEQAEMSMAALLNVSYDVQNSMGKTLSFIEAQPFAIKKAQQMMQGLVKSMGGLASPEEIALATQQSLAVGGQMFTPKQIETFLPPFMTMLKLIAPDLSGMAISEELRSFLTGQARAKQTRIAEAFGGAPNLNKQIQEARSKGGDALFKRVMEMLAPYSQGKEAVQSTMGAKLTKLGSEFQFMLRANSGPFLDSMDKILKDFSAMMKDPSFTKSLQDVASTMGDLGQNIVSMLPALLKFVSAIGNITTASLKYYRVAQDYYLKDSSIESLLTSAMTSSYVDHTVKRYPEASDVIGGANPNVYLLETLKSAVHTTRSALATQQIRFMTDEVSRLITKTKDALPEFRRKPGKPFQTTIPMRQSITAARAQHGVVGALGTETPMQDAPELDFFEQLQQGMKQLPDATKMILDDTMDVIQEFSAEAASTIVDAFDPTTNVDIRQRIGQFFKSLAQTLIQQLIMSGISSMISAAGTAGGSSIGGLVPPAFAEFHAEGGIAGEGSTTPKGSDTVPAMLTPGEVVLQTSAVRKYGSQMLLALNEGLVDPMALRGLSGVASGRAMRSVAASSGPYFAEGGRVGDRPTTGAAQAPSGGGSTRAYVVSDDQTLDRMLRGGQRGFLRFLEENSTAVNAALGSSGRGYA